MYQGHSRFLTFTSNGCLNKYRDIIYAKVRSVVEIFKENFPNYDCLAYRVSNKSSFTFGKVQFDSSFKIIPFLIYFAPRNIIIPFK